MHAAAIDEFGGPITPHVLPVPKLGTDEVLIRVESAGVGVWDTFEQDGGFAQMFGTKGKFPYVLGSDGAGTVADLGRDVSAFRKGERVYACGLANPKGGFYAEYTAVKADTVSRIPGGLTTEQAGVLASDGLTALQGLDNVLGLKAGESVLIFGASGGIGHLAVQLAKHMGARVFAVASGQDGVAFVKGLGADAVIDGHKDHIAEAARRFAPRGFDAALLTAGGEAANKALQAVADGGRVAHPNGVEPAPKARPGVSIKSYDVSPTKEALDKLNRLIERGPFAVHVARTFPASRAGEAHEALSEHFLGKLALRPGS
jgi:NADPH:quinone reductase-like Zn-dependent oxidoreductase